MAPQTSSLQDKPPRHGQPSGSEGRTAKSNAAPFVEPQPLGPDGKLEQHCDWCNNQFRPRHGSGGSKQRFCSTECRMSFHKEAQRKQRTAAYIAPTTLPATSPRPTETLTREPTTGALHP